MSQSVCAGADAGKTMDIAPDEQKRVGTKSSFVMTCDFCGHVSCPLDELDRVSAI
jgi:hypothetical protein